MSIFCTMMLSRKWCQFFNKHLGLNCEISTNDLLVVLILPALPSDFCIPLKSDADCWNIRGTFVIKASNVLEMVIYEEDKRPAHLRTLQVNYNIDAQSVPLVSPKTVEFGRIFE